MTTVDAGATKVFGLVIHIVSWSRTPAKLQYDGSKRFELPFESSRVVRIESFEDTDDGQTVCTSTVWGVPSLRKSKLLSLPFTRREDPNHIPKKVFRIRTKQYLERRIQVQVAWHL